MLKTIDPLLTGELLRLMDQMGHGDQLGLVDRNFPAHRYGVPAVPIRGVDVPTAAAAVLSLFPLDSYVSHPIQRMETDGEPDTIHAVTAALASLARAAEGRDVALEGVERFDFYQRAAEATAFVQTGETTGYSCYLLRKGVI